MKITPELRLSRMPLNALTDKPRRYVEPGHLYIVATPIGNRDDITLRALGVLKEVDLVAAEDTRHTSKLFSLHGISNRTLSCHEHNEKERIPLIIGKLKDGMSVALVSDAGTPTVSDPGYRLVKAAVEHSIPVVPIPGVCASITALCASGLPTDAFVFMGFLDRKKQKRALQIDQIRLEKRTVILYESPRRMIPLLTELTEVMGNRRAILTREMTKLYEEFIRGTFAEILAEMERREEIKGECTLVIAGGEDETASPETLRDEIKMALKTSTEKPSVMAKRIADKTGVSRQVVYDEILKLKKE
jgi:16S rRNA (cytidine1402-2'-O)-methyltransferase